jgi:hypothetical protein
MIATILADEYNNVTVIICKYSIYAIIVDEFDLKTVFLDWIP